MIILDEEAQRHYKFHASIVAGPTLRRPERVLGRSSARLPDYETSQAQHSYVLIKDGLDQKRVDARFWRATFYAIAIYVALFIVIGIPVTVVKLTRRHRGCGNTMAIHGNATTCNKWQTIEDNVASDGVYSASTRLSFDASGTYDIRTNITLLNDGYRNVHGNLTVGLNSDRGEKDATLLWSLRSSSAKLRQRTKVCFDQEGSSKSFYIHIPSNLARNDQLIFDIQLLFPHSSAALSVSKFITYLPSFTQIFGYLGPSINFGQVSVESSSADIIIESMQAEQATIQNSLADIRGVFIATQSLILDTLAGSIDTNVTLVHDSSQQMPTSLLVDTGNGRLNTRVTLVAPPVRSLLRSVPHPSFVAKLRTFNGPLTANFSHDSSTPPVPFHLSAENNLAPTDVTIDSKYEGTFSIRTKLANATLYEDAPNTSADPSGAGRPRRFIYDHVSTASTSGWVGWGERPTLWDSTPHGHVDIMNTYTPVTLRLGVAPL